MSKNRSRCSEEREQNQAMVDAIRECLGLDPLYGEAPNKNRGKVYCETVEDPIRTRP